MNFAGMGRNCEKNVVERHSTNLKVSLLLIGARSRNRTGTPLRARDFKSDGERQSVLITAAFSSLHPSRKLANEPENLPG